MEMEYETSFPQVYMDLYNAVDDPSMDSVISWSKSNKSFIIWDRHEFQAKVLMKDEARGFSPCVSMLYDLGFRRVRGKNHILVFGHRKYFVRGQPHLMKLLWEAAKKMRTRKLLAMERRAKELEARKMALELAYVLQKVQI